MVVVVVVVVIVIAVAVAVVPAVGLSGRSGTTQGRPSPSRPTGGKEGLPETRRRQQRRRQSPGSDS